MAAPKTPLTAAASRRGASMGRTPNQHATKGHALRVKVALRKVALDAGGYDAGGAYWGSGLPLYWAGSEDGTVDMFFRASDRHSARLHVFASFPHVSFYRR